MRRRLILLAPLALAACATVGDQLLFEANTPTERVFRLAVVNTITSEMLWEQALDKPDLAQGYLNGLEDFGRAIKGLDPDGLFFETDAASVVGEFKAILGSAARSHLIDLIKVGVGSKLTAVKLLFGAIGDVGRLRNLQADVENMLALIDAGTLTTEAARAGLDMRTETNVLKLKALVELRR